MGNRPIKLEELLVQFYLINTRIAGNLGLYDMNTEKDVAEREGFEPSEPLQAHAISSRAQSSTLSSFPAQRESYQMGL